jgi:hypothetical protein
MRAIVRLTWPAKAWQRSAPARMGSPGAGWYTLGTLFAVMLVPGVARPESVTWNASPPGPGDPSCPTGGRWNDGNCWIYGSHELPLRIPPRTGDTVTIYKVPGTVTLDTNISPADLAVSARFFEQGNHEVKTTDILAGETLGLVSAPTTWDQSGGSNTTAVLGIQSGTYQLSGGKVAAGQIGLSSERNGNSTFDQQGPNTTVTITRGLLSSGGLVVADLGPATYNLRGGMLSAAVESVGSGSNGSFVQSGGTNTVTSGLFKLGSLTLGVKPGAVGSYELSGDSTSVLNADVELIGPAGEGTLKQTGGINVSGEQIVGLNGIGKVDQSGGNSSTAVLLVGEGHGGSGTYTLSGNATLNADSETIGSGAFLRATSGSFTQDGGTNTVKGTLLINDDTAPSSRYTSNGGTLQAASIVNHGILELFGGNVKAGTLENFGTLTYALGSLQANVTNESGGFFKTVGAGMRPALVLNGSFDNLAGATLDVSGATKIGAFHDAGPVVFDPSTAEVSQITVAATGYLVAGAGSELKVDGDFVNQSTQRALWNTSQATLDFSGTGTHRFVLNGTAGGGAANNYAWGTLSLERGSILDLVAGAGNALDVGTLQGVDVSGGSVTNIQGSPGLVIYYDSADNPGLHGQYRLMGGGELIAVAGGTTGVPEPGTLGLLAAGLALSLIGGSRLRRRRHAG